MTVFQLNGYYVFLMFFDVIIFQTSFNSLYTVLMYINSFHILYSQVVTCYFDVPCQKSFSV